MKTKVDFEKEVGKGNDAFQLIQIGRFAMLVGVLLLGLLFNVDSALGYKVVFSLSGFIGGIGIIMHAAGKRLRRKNP